MQTPEAERFQGESCKHGHGELGINLAYLRKREKVRLERVGEREANRDQVR